MTIHRDCRYGYNKAELRGEKVSNTPSRSAWSLGNGNLHIKCDLGKITFDLKGAGREFLAVHEVGTREGLPAIAGTHGALHMVRLKDEGIAFDLHLVGRVVEAVLVGHLEGRGCGAVGGVHALGMVEGEHDALALVLIENKWLLLCLFAIMALLIPYIKKERKPPYRKSPLFKKTI